MNQLLFYFNVVILVNFHFITFFKNKIDKPLKVFGECSNRNFYLEWEKLYV